MRILQYLLTFMAAFSFLGTVSMINDFNHPPSHNNAYYSSHHGFNFSDRMEAVKMKVALTHPNHTVMVVTDIVIILIFAGLAFAVKVHRNKKLGKSSENLAATVVAFSLLLCLCIMLSIK